MKRQVPQDPRGGHIRLYWALVDGPAWGSLSATDQRAYVALRRVLGRTNNGDLSLPLSRAKHHRITSPATLAKSLRALIAVGLIAVTRRGGCTRGGQRLPTLYRFTDEQVFPMPAKLIEAYKATNEWAKVESIAHGRKLIQQTEAFARQVAAEKRLLQKLKDTSTNGEAVTAKTSTNTEAWRVQPVRGLKRAKGTATPRDANDDAGLGVVGSASP